MKSHRSSRLISFRPYQPCVGHCPANRNMRTHHISRVLLVAGLFATLTCGIHATECTTGFFKSGSRCIPCPLGHYQDEENQTSCKPCSAGTFTPFPGSLSYTQCLACPTNTFSKAGSSRCTPCPPGKPSGIGASECGYCEPGHGFWEYGCTQCDSGYYNDGTMRVCALCPTGTRTNTESKATSCIKCPPGTFRDTRYVSFSPEFKCFPCLRTTYSDQEGTEQCKLCPLGSVSEKGSTKCTSCPPGTYRGHVKHRICRPCEAGTSSKGLNPARCRHPSKGCPWGSFEDAFGECRACMPGEKLDAARKLCVRCADNEVSPGGAVTQCTQCPPGKEPASSLSVYEKSFCQCKLGTTEATDGGCEKCPAGTFGSARPAGALWNSFMRTWDNREPSCSECSPGTYSREGMTRCEVCPEGTVAESFGAKSCNRCPVGTRSNPALAYYKGDTIESGRTSCQRFKGDCENGKELDQQGDCREIFCLSTSSGYCAICGPYERFDPVSRLCVDCPVNTGNKFPHQLTTCSPCQEYAYRNFEDGACRCQQSFIMVGNRCVSCGAKKVSVGNQCVSCKSGIPIVHGNVTSCSRCTGAQYQETPQSLTCTKCPDGFIRGKNVLGEPIEGCMPKGGIL